MSEAKVNLSEAESTKIIFNPLGESFQRTIEREEFEMWIGDDLERIRIALDKTLNSASISDSNIDKVFLTGGSSFVPAVRRMFTERFGQEKLEMGSELLSIAQGLALIGARDDADDWVSDG